MFVRKTKEDSKLDEAIDKALDELLEYGPDAKEFNDAVGLLERLTALRSKDRPRVSRDQWALIGGNLLGILIVVGYEHAHVVTTKALGFTLKSK